jgi:hypothetical protein
LFTAEWAGKHGATIAALRAVLAQQAEPVEPVAWSGYDLDGMVEAFSRVIEAHHSSKHPFHDPINTDAKMALRILRGFIPSMKAYATSLRTALAQQADKPQRPKCFEFALDFLGTPENGELLAYIEQLEARAALAQQAEPDLSLCPQCNGPADNGHDRSIPPHPYLCTKCMAELPQPSYNVTVVDDAHPNGIPLEQWQNKPVAWRCACGANLYIDADGAPRSKAEPVQEPQTLDAAMQQPRAMAQAYENGYKAGAAAEREAIMDEWSACVQSDLENGVRWLNEQAAKKWQESYPAMAGFADKIYARGETK